jgi:hypothetical protein
VILLRCISTALAYRDPDMDTHIQIWIWICPSSRWIALWPLIRTIENRKNRKSKINANLAAILLPICILHSTQHNKTFRRTFYVSTYVYTHPTHHVSSYVFTHPTHHVSSYVFTHPTHHVSSYVFHHITFLRTFFITFLRTFYLLIYNVSSYVSSL